MSNRVIGVFTDPKEAARTVDDLTDAGVSKNRISIVTTESTAKGAYGIETQTKGAEGTAYGGTIGAATGALLGGLTSVGALATGGIGLLAVGPVVAAFAGAGVGGVTGGALGGLIGLGFSEQEVKYFEDALNEGAVLVGVDVSETDDEDKVESLINAHSPKETATA
ncbi:MAG: general stress protein [Planctomycetota bacterium]